MSVDNLVDSTLLNASCTYEAGKIREKLGSAAQIAYDLANGKGFGDAIEAIPTGGGGPTDNEYASAAVPSGDLTVSVAIATQVFFRHNNITKVTQTALGCGARAFQEATGLQYFVGKGTTYFYAQVFKGCSNLLGVDVGASYSHNKFETENFAQCSKFNLLILRKSTIIDLSGGVNVFLSTPFRNSNGGTIYIPKALYDHLGDGTSLDYKADTNWSTLDGYGFVTWAKIEGSTYETHYVDGTTIT